MPQNVAAAGPQEQMFSVQGSLSPETNVAESIKSITENKRNQSSQVDSILAITYHPPDLADFKKKSNEDLKI